MELQFEVLDVKVVTDSTSAVIFACFLKIELCKLTIIINTAFIRFMVYHEPLGACI